MKSSKVSGIAVFEKFMCFVSPGPSFIILQTFAIRIQMLHVVLPNC